MGARLVTQVLTRWTHVNDRAFRVLVRMAHTALDERSGPIPPGVYFGGHDLLALTLRSERGGSPAALAKTVKRAVADLIKEGAIERTNAARAGHNQEYRLTLDGARHIDQLPVDDEAPGGHQRTPSGGHQRTPSGGLWRPTRGTPADPPRNQEEPLQELLQEPEEADLRTAVTVPRTHDAAKDPPNSIPGRCTRHPAMPAGRCPICRAQTPPRQPPLMGVITGGAA